MSVRKIGNSWWVDFCHKGVRYRKRSATKTRAGAEAYEVILRQMLDRNGNINDSEAKAENSFPTFTDFSQTWYETYVMSNNRKSERLGKFYILKSHLRPFFGQCKLDEITGLSVENYKANKQKENLAPKTINNHLTVLKKCLKSADEWLQLPKLPLIKFLRVPPQKFDFLTAQEIQQLVSTIHDPLWRALVIVALHTGLRRGELRGLKWENVYFSERMLRVRYSLVRGELGAPKNNRERIVPLTETVCKALAELPRACSYVFSQGGKPLSVEALRYHLNKYCRDAGLRHIGWHVFRHSFASLLTISQVPLRAVQDLLGHSDIKMTMRYSHLAPSALHEAVRVLDIQKFGQQAVNASVIGKNIAST